MMILHGNQQSSRLCMCYHKQWKRQGVVQGRHLYLHPLLPTSVVSSFSLHPYVQKRTSAWWIPSHKCPWIHALPSMLHHLRVVSCSIFPSQSPWCILTWRSDHSSPSAIKPLQCSPLPMFQQGPESHSWLLHPSPAPSAATSHSLNIHF